MAKQIVVEFNEYDVNSLTVNGDHFYQEGPFVYMKERYQSEPVAAVFSASVRSIRIEDKPKEDE